ncbi:MAG: alpha/beta fold hydrolase [Alphaproteobacteria bacterium]
MSAAATQHIVAVAGGREVAFRRVGSGPPVVLLHASPRSSIAVMPLAQHLAQKFTVFAFDTPGFGLSEPLPFARADADVFANALLEAFDAIGLGRVPLFGSHTGAVIAMEFARRYPARVACLAFDGYPVFTPLEQAEALASYLMPIRPDWEGTYLAWLWSRVRDQLVFFPWYTRGSGTRLPIDTQPLAFHQAVLNDFLSAGDHYRVAYAAAFRYEPIAPIGEVKVPVSYITRTDDMLFPHLDRMPPLTAKDEIVRLTEDRAVWAATTTTAMSRAAGDAAAPSSAGFDDPDMKDTRIARRIVQVPGGQVMIRVAGTRGAKPIVLIHGTPAASRGLEPVMRALAAKRRVIALDLPGHGGSSPADAQTTVEAMAATLMTALTSLKLGGADIVGFEGGAAVAAALARQLPNAGRCIAVDPLPESDSARNALRAQLVDIAPVWGGGHLLAAWHHLRDAELWKPWFDRRLAAGRQLGADQDVAALDAGLAEWMRGGESYLHAARAMLSASPGAALRGTKAIVIGFDSDPDLAAAQATAQAANARFVATSRHAEHIAATILHATEAP